MAGNYLAKLEPYFQTHLIMPSFKVLDLAPTSDFKMQFWLDGVLG